MREISKKNTKIDSSRILVCFVFAALIGFTAFIWKMSHKSLDREINNYVATTVDYADQRIASLYYEINNMPSGAGNDLLFLSKMYALSALSQEDREEREERGAYLANSFEEFMNQNQAYLSIRVIDKNGQDVYGMSRTNIDGVYNTSTLSETPSDGLDLFNVVSALTGGQVYISNFETGSHDNFPVWTMKYATPLYNNNGQCDAIVVLTVNVEYFLEDIRNYSRPGEPVFLVNSNGFYLASADREKESLRSGARFNFHKDYPDAANEILSDTNRRSYETKDKLFTFRRISPTLSSFVIYEGTKDGEQNIDQYYWVLVSVSDRMDSETTIRDLYSQYKFIIGITIALVFFVGICVLAANRLARQRSK